jgi:hypothetical protein
MRLRLLFLADVNRIINEFFRVISNIFPFFLSYLEVRKDHLHEHFESIGNEKVRKVDFFGKDA